MRTILDVYGELMNRDEAGMKLPHFCGLRLSVRWRVISRKSHETSPFHLLRHQ